VCSQPTGPGKPFLASHFRSDCSSAVKQSLVTAGTGATIVATSTLSAVTPSSAASSSGGHHSRGHAAAIAVPVVLGMALVACKTLSAAAHYLHHGAWLCTTGNMPVCYAAGFTVASQKCKDVAAEVRLV